MTLSQQIATDLIHGLVSIPSLSRHEEAASTWLVDQMAQLGYDRAFVDKAGNAVGEIGSPDSPRTVLLLGHIDTVPGDIPVRIVTESDDEEHGPLLYGRGSVDAKGPLATFAAAVAKVGSAWAAEKNIRLVVVGATEEESATSKGARFIRDRFDGSTEPIPDACIIGEPSNWRRVTLGYKGRVLIDVEANQPMAHTAGPDAGVGTIPIDLWNWVWGRAQTFNQGLDKPFDQLLPSLRRINTSTDEQMHDHAAMQLGIRLPLDFALDEFLTDLTTWLAARIEADPYAGVINSTSDLTLAGSNASVALRFYGHEKAWRSDRNNMLVRSFQAAIREIAPGTRPGFVSKTGTSDMNVVGPAWQCPILAYGPGDSTLDHTPNEHLDLDEYWRAVLVLEQALCNLGASL